MTQEGRGPAGFSPVFLAEVVRELRRVQRRIDAIDARLERCKGQAAKERLTEQRKSWVRYERFLRERLLR